ncbi:HMG-I/HMG-Y, DNA-binding, conserved site [Cinara cedri]|uniref:HMG-I/HMG-Y, DNA-binding, conserved site n=1 Tax=Cinara cedri TaxID=506608 RepID=A0A5E4NFV4_9HEMI|nr:HMG-I/HMG-Y, DNA-binding, conserved site [Cinara cedri]
MELLPENNHVDNVVIQGHTFEKVHQFTYLGASISGNNDWSIELNRRNIKAEKASFSLTKYLKSKLFSRRTKVHLYMAIIRPTLKYGCWRRRTNKETRDLTGVPRITNFVKTQRIKWFGHVMRRSNSDYLKAAIEWKPTGKRPRGRPKKRWIDGIKQDLEKLGISNWEDKVQNREEWREVSVAAKTLEEL